MFCYVITGRYTPQLLQMSNNLKRICHYLIIFQLPAVDIGGFSAYNWRTLNNIVGFFMPRYFNAAQIPLTNRAFNDAEKLVSRNFRISEEELKRKRYDVKTLVQLEEHEIKEGAFAHLCKYAYEKPAQLPDADIKSFDFYRICLQDNIILDAVERANSFIKFSPLMLYIATHELIHVLRFSNGEIDFDASVEEKEQEEAIVHNLTKFVLQPVKHHDLDIVLDCFSSSFNIYDLYN